MKMPAQTHERLCLAALPLMLYAESVWLGFLMSALTVAAYWLTALVFWALGRWLSPALLKAVSLFWLAVLAQVVWSALGILPLWTLSLLLLVPFEGLAKDSRERKTTARGSLRRYFSERFLSGVLFVLFVSLWSGLSDLMVWRGWSEEGILAGAFFTLFLLSWASKQMMRSRAS